MAKTDQAYHEHYRRQHRTLGAYLALHCWHNGYDAVIVPRGTLAKIHELKRFTGTHLSWLQDDIRPYFRHSVRLFYADTPSKFFAVALSRVPIPKTFGSATMTDEQRAKQWRSGGFKICALSELPTCDGSISEQSVASFLALVAAGLEVPTPKPTLLPVARTPQRRTA